MIPPKTCHWNHIEGSVMKSETKQIDNLIEKEPYYLPTSHEVTVFIEAYHNQFPLILRGSI